MYTLLLFSSIREQNISRVWVSTWAIRNPVLHSTEKPYVDLVNESQPLICLLSGK